MHNNRRVSTGTFVADRHGYWTLAVYRENGEFVESQFMELDYA